MKWDASFDVVVVGSGAAGLTAGLSAKLQGLKSLVIEKNRSLWWCFCNFWWCLMDSQ
ncbi:FAD-binding protein [Lysinibacillus sp. MHQ-1]|nr:FAD-binding protein [Lysinibacillus sp. MHQ-1]